MVQGKKKNEDIFFNLEEEVNENELTTFCDNESEMTDWNFLNITTTPIGP